jgi:predicted transcriptional regulator
MAKKKDTFTRQIAKALDGCGETRYRVAKNTGISQATLSRLVNRPDGWMNRERLDRLADYLGLSVKPRKGNRAR